MLGLARLCLGLHVFGWLSGFECFRSDLAGDYLTSTEQLMKVKRQSVREWHKRHVFLPNKLLYRCALKRTAGV